MCIKFVLLFLLFQVSVRCFNIADLFGSHIKTRPAPNANVNKVPVLKDAVFPSVTSKSSEDIFFPYECQRTGICERTENDQDELVEKIIKDLQMGNETFDNDLQDVKETIIVVDRSGRPIDVEGELCKSIRRYVIPKWVRDSYETWHRVLNTDIYPIQIFYVEMCSEELAPCSSIITFEIGYKGVCEQKHVTRRLKLLNSKNEVVETHIDIPCHCSCVARFLDETD